MDEEGVISSAHIKHTQLRGSPLQFKQEALHHGTAPPPALRPETDQRTV